MSAKSDVLRSIPLFSGMTDRSIDAIGGITANTQFPLGTTVVREGDLGDSFVVIVEGAASVEQAGQRLRDLGPGDFFGEIALLDGGPRTATVTATSQIDALVVDRAGFDRLMQEFPVVRHDVINALTQRLRQSDPKAFD